MEYCAGVVGMSSRLDSCDVIRCSQNFLKAIGFVCRLGGTAASEKRLVTVWQVSVALERYVWRIGIFLVILALYQLN